MNRYSILQDKKECYICRTTYNLHLHHTIFGKNRKKCDEDKLTVWLCQEHYEGIYGVHGKHGHDLDMLLKVLTETKWIEYYNKTKEDFIKRYGRSYL